MATLWSSGFWSSGLVLVGVALAGCPRSTPQNKAPEETLLVFAAASLREALSAMEPAFAAAHPAVEVTFNFVGTQELRTQLEHGAAADVFASADQRHMQALFAAARVEEPVVFARNQPVVVVAEEKAVDIQRFEDLISARRIVIGRPEVPIGRYTDQILEGAAKILGPRWALALEKSVVSRELNVRQVLAKVTLGEAQAGIVYKTDARAAGNTVAVVEIPEAINVVAEYTLAIVRDAPHPRLARAFVDLVLSPAGQRALTEAGFAPAPAPAAAGEGER